MKSCDGTPAVGQTTVNIDDGSKFNVGDIVHFFEADGQQYEVTGISIHLHN